MEHHHKVECETEEMLKCRISSKRFEEMYWANEHISHVPNKAPDGHYVDYSTNEIGRYFRILAPTPSDSYTYVYFLYLEIWKGEIIEI